MEYNLYCDESSHLFHSRNKIMTLGFVSCPKEMAKQIARELREIKIAYNLNPKYELKWTKVSVSKIDYYKELIDYFFSKHEITSRIIIADKSNLQYELYGLSHDEWYYRQYYLLFGKTLCENDRYNIYIDIKDTNSAYKIFKLKEVLSKSYYDYAGNMFKNMQHIRSHESELLQLNDLIIGAIAYKNNNLGSSPAKKMIVEYLAGVSGKDLISKTDRTEEKLNIFKWEASYYGQRM